MRVHSQATINLSNGESVLVEQAKIGEEHLNKNIILSTKINEELSGADKNPLGSIAYNSMVLKIQSGNKSLVPENKTSPYYGYMDSTAIINIKVTDDDGQVEMGTFYVKRWYSTISSEERKTITIEGDGYMRTISKMLMPSMEIKKNETVKNYINSMIERQNENLSERYKIEVDENISFGDFGTMEYSNIDASTMGEALEIMSQSTLTNIYIDRDNKLKTDYCFDDNASQQEYTLGDCINIKTIKAGDGGLSDYAGVEVKYNNYIVNNISSLAQLSNQKLSAGETEFKGINANSKIFKVMYVSVSSDSESSIEVTSIRYDKGKIDLTVNNTSGEEVNANIEVFGQTLNESQQSTSKYITGKQGTALQIENNIISKSAINNFLNKMLKLIGLKNTVLQASGWFNPRIKLGDIVYVDAEKTINTTGYYKIIGLEWQIATTIQCIAKMVKLIT